MAPLQPTYANILLYLRIEQEKYVLVYKEFITQIAHICYCYQNFDLIVPTHLTHYSTKIERNP